MDTTIEKMAKAFAFRQWKELNPESWIDDAETYWSTISSESVRNSHISGARAAIEVLIKHGPTQSMLDAGARNLHILGYDDLPTDDEIDQMFRAMLRAAIAGK